MSSIEVYVTYLEKEGPFLKLWVQLNRSSAMFVEKLIRQYTDQFERGHFVTHPSALIVGGICCAKYVDGMYYRARIISLANVSEGKIYVQFCDFGNKEVVPVSNIRNVQVRAGEPQPPLVAVPDQATEFYLAGVLPSQGAEWDDSTVEHIRQKLGYEEFQGVIVGETARKRLLALYSGGIDVSQILVQEGLAVSITPGSQQALSHGLHAPQPVSQKVNPPTVSWQQFTPPPQVNRVVSVKPNPAYQVETMRAARTNVNMKKSPVQQGSGRVFGLPVLEVNSEHMVYVSFVDDGPLAFSVQLKAFEDQLSSMSVELNENSPQPMLKPLLPGSVCLGRFSEDHLLCRAVVMSVMDDRCMVYYVDFGNSEVLPYSDIYEIPDKYMNLKSMALRYCLAGMRDTPLNDDLKDEFKRIVLDKLLKMKVVPPEGPPVKQYCELYLEGKNVKDLLLEKLKLQQLSKGYKKMPLPSVGLFEKVYVSYVESVSSFYVQLEANVSGLTNVMNYLASYCTRTQVQGFSPSQVQVGMPCCALFAADGRWYRAKITGVESNMVQVFYVDYGNSDSVPLSSLCKIEPTLLSQSPEQAIRCILNGYEHSGNDDDISATFELIVIEKLLSMKVLKHTGGCIVVDLYDATVQPMKNISDLLMVSQTKTPAVTAPPESDNDWQESATAGTTYGDNSSGSNKREQYGGRGLKKRNKASQPSDRAPYNKQRGNEDRNPPFRKSHRHESSVSHWQNKGEEMSSESTDTGAAKGGSRFPSGGNRRDDRKSNSEAGRMGSDKEWDRNTRYGNKGGRYRDENTEPDGESQSDVFQSDRGGRQGNNRDRRRFPGGEREEDSENRWAPDRGRDRPYDSNRRGSGGRFRGSDRENDGENGRHSNRDSSRSYDENRGGSYGNRERGGGNRRGGRFGDRDNDWGGGGKGGRRFGTTENSTSDDSSWNNNRKWEEKPDRNANKRDRWNSRDTGNSFGSYQNTEDSTAVPAEEDLWGETEPSPKTISPVDVQLNTVHTMHLIYVVNPSEFCLQMTDDTKLNALMEKIAAKYGDGGGTSLDNIKEGVTCAALYSLDGSWNRAVIETVHTDTVLCRFIDYGNSDEIPHSGLKMLEKDFELLPAQAIKCALLCAKPSVNSWSEEEILRFKEATDGKEMNTKFVKRKGDVYEVILREAADSSKSINEDFGADPFEMENIAAATSVSSAVCDNVDSVCATFGDKYQLQNTVGTKHDVVVSWFVNPENFYCQLISLQNELKTMMESIQTDYRKKKRQKVNVVVDTPVIARFKSDKVLYRAIVKELKGNAVVVQYIDFGNCDIADTSDIWPLEKKYLSYPVYALQCCLKGVKSPNSEWQISPSDVGKFFSEKLVCTFHEQVDHKYMITLENNGSSVADALITEGIAVEDEKAPSATNISVSVEEDLDLSLCQGQCLAAHVTYVCSLFKFFVHLNPARAIEIQACIENHMQQYSETAGKLTASSLKRGKMCLATPDGVSWYRAVIMETHPDHVTTNFIDFGDTAEVPLERMAPIPSDMVSCHRLAIECSVVGSSSDTSGELDEQFKLEVEEQDVILHVDSVCEDRLCVRLFDVEGQRLELLKELYNENLQEVEPVCPLPVLSSKMKVCVSHVEDTAPFFWIQNVQDIVGLSQLLESWFDFYESKASGKDLIDIKPGKLCAAKSGNDDNWYRARINSVDNENVMINFIDYGNTEIVPVTNIKALDDSFYSPHAMALKVCLPVNVVDNEKTVSEFQNYTAEKEFIAQLYRNTSEEECWFIDLISEGKRLIDELSNLGLITESEDSPFAGNFMVKSISEGVKTSVYVTHVESPSSFWVQLGSNLDEIEKLRNMLQKHADTADSMKTLPEVGMLCAAQYSEDASWYRAVVMNLEQSTVTVSFIDYGNTDKITLSSSGLKPLKPDLISLPPFGIKCSLDIMPMPGETEWSEAAIKKFNEIVDETGGVMVAEVLKSTDVNLVTLYTDESNVSSILIDLNLAISPATKVETPSVSQHESSEVDKSGTIGIQGNKNDNLVFVSHCDSPANFWVQHKIATEKLQYITEKMENACNFSVFPDAKEGALCGALFRDDGLWYRARILSQNSDEISVLFIDYGNTSTTDEVRVLPSDLLQMPGIAEHCSLILPEELNEWPENACSEFLRLVSGGETEFHMKLVKDGTLKVVSLEYNGKPVELMLKQLCLKESVLEKICTITDETSETMEVLPDKNLLSSGDSVFVSHCDSPSDFWIQQKNATEKLHYITEKMENASTFNVFTDAKEGELCGALFKEDGLWYRAIILSRNSDEISVRFIDYGNTSTTDEIRVLPPDLLQIPAIAEHCSLILPEEINEWSENTCSEFLTLVGGGETEFHMKLVKDGTLKVVSLDYNGKPVELMLKQLCLKESGLEKVSTVTDETSETMEVLPDKNLLSSGDSVFVSHCDSPSDFWIQHKNATEKLHYITEKMENASTFNVFPDAKEGELCGALFKEDGLWYRAKILSRNSDEISVRFIDYGNTSSTDEIRVLPPDLLQIPAIAEHCSLILPEEINEWSENTCSEFLTLVGGGETEFHMKLVKDGTLKVVSLHYNGEPVELMLKQSYLKESGLEKVSTVTDEMSDAADECEKKNFDVINSGVKEVETKSECKSDDTKRNDALEVNQPPEVDKQEDSEIELHASGGDDAVYVSHCDSPADFWVQRKSAVEKLQYVTERMEDAPNFTVFSDAKEGELCAALFNDDGLWYRAKILSCDSNEISVQFIDYGNTSTTDELRVLPSDLLQMPGIAEHCSLILPEGINKWSENTGSEFLTLVSGGETEFHMKLMKEGPSNVVSLEYNGRPVELILKQSSSQESDIEKVSTPMEQSPDTAGKSEEERVDVNKPEISDGEFLHASKEIDTPTSSKSECNDCQINDTPKVNDSAEVSQKEGTVSGDGDLVFVSHCDSPVDFWIQRKSAAEKLHYVTERMEIAPNFSVFPDAKEGDLCGALFKDDGLWYRARILSQNSDEISVQFIDYGNTSTTDALCILPPDLLKMPGIAEHCSLNLPEGINDFSENACSEFLRLVSGGETEFHMKLVKDGPLKVISLEYNGEPVELMLKQSCLKERDLEKIITPTDEISDTAKESEKKTFVASTLEITDGEACKEIDTSVSSHKCVDSKINDTPKVNETFEVDERVGREMQVHVKDSDSVFVSHCDSPADFWIQRKSAVEKLHYVTERMEDASNFSVFSDAKEGELCAALFNDDGLWYRAKILSCDSNEISVQFIDYGNTSTTDELRVLPSDLLQMPGIAEHCSLILPEEINEWPENTCSEFLSLVSGGETEFHMKLVKEGPLKVVCLEYNGEPVDLMLKQSYSKENLQKVSTSVEETSGTVEEHVSGTPVSDKTLLQNTGPQLVHLSSDKEKIEDKLPQEVQSLEVLESEQKDGNQIKTKHSEMLIQDLSVEVKVQSLPDQTKKDITVPEKVCEPSAADASNAKASVDESDTTPDLLR